MIKIAIVEDENDYISVLKEYLKRYEQDNQTYFQIHIFYDGLDIVTDYTAGYDIILLDIQMKHLDGMKTAEKIRELDENVELIFITSTISFAVQGYTVEALGYVLKPVSYLAFSQILSKAVKQTEQKQTKDYLTFVVESGQIRLDISQIYYLESRRRNILIHTEKGDYITAGPMKVIESTLFSKGFSKCHNGYLVNLRHVAGIMPNSIYVSDKSELPVSRSRRKAFVEHLTDFMGGLYR